MTSRWHSSRVVMRLSFRRRISKLFWRLPMNRYCFALLACGVFLSHGNSQQLPHATASGYELPNGWRLTPLGRAIPTEDMVLNVSVAPDHKSVVALHSGFNPHGLVVVDAHSEEAAQRIRLKSAWLGLAWHPHGQNPDALAASA